jgi:hypothetical protein
MLSQLPPCASARPHPTIKFYNIKRIVNSIDSTTESSNPGVPEDESDDDDDDDWLVSDPNEPAAVPSETLDVHGQIELDLNSRMVRLVLADNPLPDEAVAAGDGSADVEMLDAEEGGTFELAEWI